MNPELRNRALMVGLLLIAWAGLVYLKTILSASVLPDLNAIIAQVQVLMGGVVGYHVGTGAGPVSVPPIVQPAPVPAGQGGFASIRQLMMIIGLALGLALLGGCASIDQAGSSSYTVRAVKGADGKTSYELDVKDGKEYAAREVQFQTVGNAASLSIGETGVKAFKGQALAAKALSVLPVTNLGDILK